MKKPVTKYLLLLFAAVLAAVGVRGCRKNRPADVTDAASYTVLKEFVWDMGTEKEKIVQILYDPIRENYWKKEENRVLYDLPDYNKKGKPIMEFSFKEEANGQLFDNRDIGVSDIFHGKIKDACSGYAYLQEQGFRNLYTIRDGISVDIYLEKENQYYRYFVMPEAGQAACTVTFAEIPKNVWNAVLRREVK